MIVVVFPDVLSCFLFHGLAYYFYVLYSVLIIAVSRHDSSFLHQSLCWRTLLDHVCDCFAYGLVLSVSNRFLNSSWNSIFFDPIRVASTLGGLLVIYFFLSTSTSNLILSSLRLLPMLTWLMTVTFVTMSGVFVRM